MKIVGQISTQEELEEIKLITKICIVGNRARLLALKTHELKTNQKTKRKNQFL